MKHPSLLLLVIFFLTSQLSTAQEVEILSYSVNPFDQVQLEIEGSSDMYYLLSATHEPDQAYESITSITMGEDGKMFISEPLAAFPEENYTITAYPVDNPGDFDNDGIDDITELNSMPTNAPLNFARQIPIIDGVPVIDSPETFSQMSVVTADIPWAPFLNNQEFAKFAIVNIDSATPEIFFINSVTHAIHNSFLATIGLNLYQDDVVTGEVVYNPNEIFYNGVIGTYSFNFSFGDTYEFSRVQKTHELLAANMPFLENNLQHFVGSGGENIYENEYKNDYIGSRIPVVLESIYFADIDYIPFNESEGYGFFRHMQLDENPGSRDIVLYDALPNSLPRVGGIITSIVQTPLSHVNLRAIQDNLPNAYIKDPLDDPAIASLLDGFVYYKVEAQEYTLRAATQEEVNEWYDNIRPTEPQIPERDLSQTEILPLDEIGFEMSTAFGAKCANVATMRTFGFPEGTIPNGFGIPFYYYDEFMKYNGFYEEAEEMLSDPDFIADLEVRIDMLKDFRRDIKDADMPQWMLDDLQEMHDSFPEGTAVRCRSSTNNEDLPGFSGAGLYTSKTQHLDEGHISKSIKQVYASMWNFRAYDEREFYRVDQFIAAMGVLCHPNFQDEKSNGVGVSIDPIYGTENTFYLNTQVGESLITNPDANSIPEELILHIDPEEGYFVLRNSNLVPNGQLVMGEQYLNQMRDYLGVIHDEFAELYDVVGAEGFGMDIEYKVTVDDQLIIKQARPWVSFWAEINATFDLGVTELTQPTSSDLLGTNELVSAVISNEGLRDMSDFEISLYVDDVFIETQSISDNLGPQTTQEYQFTTPVDLSVIGDYDITVVVDQATDGFSTNDTLTTVVRNLHSIEGSITGELFRLNCGETLAARALIENFGASLLTSAEIEVVVNGISTDIITASIGIPFESSDEVIIDITQNLQPTDNVITLNLLKLNDSQDAIDTNNSSSFTTDLDNEQEFITLEINPDNFPQETSWFLTYENDDNILESGELNQGITFFDTDYCLSYDSCYTLTVVDAYSDGICCGFGLGDISIYNVDGDLIGFDNGEFMDQTEINFCPSELFCIVSAEVSTTSSSSQSDPNGTITIESSGGEPPYSYSIDNGTNFSSDNIFTNLEAGNYIIAVTDSNGSCIYEEEILVDFEVSSNQDHVLSNEFEIFPNPTQDEFIIGLTENTQWTESIQIEIFDNLGSLIKLAEIPASKQRTTISLDDNPAGTYFLRCYSKDFEQYFKLIKM